MKRVRFRELIAGCPGQSVLRWLWYQSVRSLAWCWFRVFYRLRVIDHERLPQTGPTLIISNHQSYLDPVIIGLATGRRPTHMLARKSLFRPFFMGWLLRSLNGVPVDRGTADLASMRRCIEVLKEGVGLSIFPEGTRTEDGRVLPFKPGMLLVARRSGATVVTMAITGSFEAWPRHRRLPRLFGRITVQFGQARSIETLETMGDDAAVLSALQAEMQGLVDDMKR